MVVCCGMHLGALAIIRGPSRGFPCRGGLPYEAEHRCGRACNCVGVTQVTGTRRPPLTRQSNILHSACSVQCTRSTTHTCHASCNTTNCSTQEPNTHTVYLPIPINTHNQSKSCSFTCQVCAPPQHCGSTVAWLGARRLLAAVHNTLLGATEEPFTYVPIWAIHVGGSEHAALPWAGSTGAPPTRQSQTPQCRPAS